MKFKIWLENNQKEIQQRLRNAFSSAKGDLTGGQVKQYPASLGNIEFQGRTGPRAVLNKLGSVFDNLRDLGQYDPNISGQAEDARNWLQNIANSGESLNANHTVGTLLQKMFGDKAKEFDPEFPVISPDVTEPVQGSDPMGGNVSQGPEGNPQQPMANSPMQSPNKKQLGQEDQTTNLIS